MKRPLVGYFCQNEFQMIAPSRIGASFVAEELGYDLVFFRDWEQANLKAFDGLLFAGRPPAMPLKGTDTYRIQAQELHAAGLPIVAVNTSIEGLPRIQTDNEDGIKKAVYHLYEQGHRHFIHIHGWLTHPTQIERMDAFLKAMEELDIPDANYFTIELADQLTPDRKAIYKLLNSQFDRNAVVCWNDNTANVAISAILRAGKRIPEDFAVTGFDNIQTYHFQARMPAVSPIPLTTYDLPNFKIGTMAMEELDRRMRGEEGAFTDLRVKGCFHARASSSLAKPKPPTADEPNTPVNALIQRIHERISHLTFGSLQHWQDELNRLCESETISLDDFKRCIVKAIESGLDIFVAYPIFNYVLHKLGTTNGERKVPADALIAYIHKYIDEKEPIHQIYHYSIINTFDRITAKIKLVGKNSNQSKIAAILREVVQGLGIGRCQLFVLSEPCPENEPPKGSCNIWNLLAEGKPTCRSITLKPNFADLLDACQATAHPDAHDVLWLKSGGTIYGAMILDVRNEYWVLSSLLAEQCGEMLSYSHLIDELLSNAKELRIQRAIAEAANNAKTEFLTVMSHELRTPLNCVIGMTDAILIYDGVKEEHIPNMQLIKESGLDLLDIINDILDFSLFESDKFELHKDELELGNLLIYCMERLRDDAEKKGLALKAKLSPDLPPLLLGDAKRIKQALNKLLSNAIKYTERGSICMTADVKSVSAHALTVLICIEDTGVGIPKGSESIVFKEFSQIDSSDSRSYGGTGIGLAIVARLALKMGGKIWFESELGCGSKFFLELPFELPSTQANERSLPAAANRHGRKEQAPEESKVLVVDDDEANAILAMLLLKSGGFHPEYAASGHLAVEKFQQESFDLVLMDIQMPAMNGWQATHQMRQLEIDRYGKPITPIIALTAHAIQGYRERCEEAGMDGYITKPIERESFLANVEQAIGEKRPR